MKKVLLICLIFISCSVSYGQPILRVEYGFGPAFTKNLYINGYKIKKPFAFSSTIGANISFKLFSQYDLETGVHLKHIKSSGDIDKIRFHINKIRFFMPIYFSRKINENFQFSAGIITTHNHNTKLFVKNSNHNIRLDFSLKLKYSIHQKWDINGVFNTNVNRLPNLYYSGYPKTEFLIGASYILNKNKR